MVVPASPLHQKPTLGLDLQGGLEITKQAVPPKGRKLTKEDLTRSVSIMRDRVDRLGVSEPEIRTQGDDQITIQLPGVKDPGDRGEDHRQDGAARALRPRGEPGAAVDRRVSRFPVAKNSVYDLLAGQQALAAKGTPEQYWLFDKKKKLVVGPVATKTAALRKYDGKVPDGYKLFAVPPGTVVISCGVGEVVCPGVNEANPTSNSYYLFKYSPPDDPGDDRLRPEALRARGRTSTRRRRQPIVTMQFTKKGAKKFAEITREEAQRGKLLSNTIGQGQKIEQHFAIVLDREIKSWPSIDWEQYPGGISGSNGAQITGIGDDPGGEEPRARPPDRRPARRVRHARPDRDLGHARQGLAERGEEGGDRRPAPRGALPARLLPLPRPHRGARARDLRRLPLRRDPDLQRDPDPPRLRRPRADAGGGRRRERRHLRAHQGRGARGTERQGRDPDRLHEGLPHDRRRQRRHRDHRARPVRRRDLVRARLRADAPDRHRDLDAHRRARDPGVPLAARRREVPREPAGDRHLRRRHQVLAEDRLHRPPAALVRRSRRP